jgi:pyruvate formate lyase activating enzyme
MKIGGLRKVSLIDYPGMICAVIFTQGCNFRCGYCHNPELVNPKLFGTLIDEKEVLAFMERRTGKLDAVTISGGEPTLQKDLLPFIEKIRKMGFAVKLDTNGSQPQVIRDLLSAKLLDYIAMDIKGTWDKYENIAGAKYDQEQIKVSIESIINSRIAHEFRTTIVRSQLKEKNILEIGKIISGAQRYALQKFVSGKTLDKNISSEQTYSDAELEKIKIRLEKEISSVIVR